MSENFQDRRRSLRYTALRREARLGWWSGLRFRATKAQLVNISPEGVLVEMEEMPPRRSSVWIGAAETAESAWLEATIVAVAPARALRGGRRLRLAFVSGDAGGFFESAIRAKVETKAPSQADLEATSEALEVPEPLLRLGLTWPSTPAEVRDAYRQQAKRLHPDHGGSISAFLDLRQDYEAALALCSRFAQSSTPQAS